MSNGNQQACCILKICCTDGQQAQALSRKLATWSGGLYDSDATLSMAQGLLAEFDLVPKGVGSAIVEAYRKPFAEKEGDGKG